MAVSQNGWPVVESTAMDKTPILGMTFPNGFLKGDVAYIFRWLFTWFNFYVEPLGDGCWGYDKREIDNSGTWSNHASGTAGDVNAVLHPRGKHNTFTPRQVTAIRHMLSLTKGVIRWGGDFTTTVDEMHFEIHGTKAQVAAFAQELREQEADMTPEQCKAVVKDLLLNDPDIRAQQQARPWQYTGRGIHGAVSTLEALADSQDIMKAITDLTANVASLTAIMAELHDQA